MSAWLRSIGFDGNGARLLCVALALVMPCSVYGQYPPDCTGVSDASNHDGATISNFDGLLTTVRLASGLEAPVFMTAPPGDDRMFILEQHRGRIKILEDGAILPTPFLDIEPLVKCCLFEEGLLGLAFHPDYATNGYLFLYHTKLDGDNVLARYSVDPGDPNLADPSSRVDVITFTHQPTTGHNAGSLRFGPDGYLYIATGDGAFNCDVGGNSQSKDSLLGKILRINVDSLPYTTAGNPFDGAIPGRDEVWAYGLRNPWQFSIDPVTSAMYIGDVGGIGREELNCIPGNSVGGENFGWPVFEGSICPPPPNCTVPSCSVPNYSPPLLEYEHGTTNAIIGGLVYRGCRMSDLHGTYFYADFPTGGDMWSFRTDGTCGMSSSLVRTADLAPVGGYVINGLSSFTTDRQGELYIVDRGAFEGGEIYKVVPVLSVMETSGVNATPFFPSAVDEWSWENLEASSSHPVTSYRIYRAADDPAGPFFVPRATYGDHFLQRDEVFVGARFRQIPNLGGILFYVVTAVSDETGEESSPGYRSDGTPRLLNPCP